MSRDPEFKPPHLLTRRQSLGILARASAGAFLAGPLSTSAANPFTRPRSRPKQVALLATEVRKYSHAQHFIDRLLEGYGWNGRHHYPAIQLASLYVDQFPERDLARDRSNRHNVPIFETIPDALTLGKDNLAVDGVIIIGEHGKYPRNEKGQTLYPRYAFFKKVVEVFERSGRSVPVFNDKHLSTNWAECAEMVEDSRRLGFAFLAGSSLPVTWRIPALEIPPGTELVESVCACYGGVDSYDFHGLETAQCMSERRAGGEVGVKSVHAIRGDRLWSLLAKRESTTELLFAALARSHTVQPPPGYTAFIPDLDWIRQRSPDAVGYFIEHLDGLRTAMFLLNGLVLDFTYAGRVKTGEILSCQMHLPMPPRNTTLANFFNPLMHHIEQTILNEQATYPVERTLLTSGMTLFAVESLHQGETPIATPEMNVAYGPPQGSFFWNS